MNVTLAPGPRTGRVSAPASKSQAHRLLLAAALSAAPATLRLDGLSRDIEATIDCLRALGAEIAAAEGSVTVTPGRLPGGLCRLPCGESGSTLRFLLPLAGALGAEAAFLREGRLPRRPLAPLDRELTAHGMTLREDGGTLFCGGRLRSGDFCLPGDVSSQYFTGLLFALPLLEGDSRLRAAGELQSAGYVEMTLAALSLAGIRIERREGEFLVPGGQAYRLPSPLAVEGDYSAAAFFLCMGALAPAGVAVSGLTPDSRQGDRAILSILRRFGAAVTETPDGVSVRRGTLRGITLDASQVPDLVPAVAALAAAAEGETRICRAERLRLKESDRLASVCRVLRALGATAEETADGLAIRGRSALSGGTADACGDHRIAMAAAVAACRCRGPVTVTGAEAVAKSYPRFWEEFASLEGSL